MKKNRSLIILFLLALCALIFTGCGEEQAEEENIIVYKYGKTEVSYGEFYIYAKTVEEDYQKAYGKGIWSLELETEEGKSTVRDITVKDLVNNINRVKVLISHADELNVSLGDSETLEAERIAENFYNGLTDSDIREMKLSRELALQVIEENLLAAKVYEQVISENDFEISDEEARMTTFYDMVFECNGIKADGTVEEYTEEKKAVQLEKANEALSTLAQEEDVSYDSIVKKYDLQYSSSYTMSKAEIIKEYGSLIAEKISELPDGAVSAVMESDYGYHIFKMIKSNDEELTRKNKEQIIAQKQKEYFSNVYEAWEKKYDSHFDYDEDVDTEITGKFPFSE